MKSFIVAEIASNWEGNIAVAKKLISQSKLAGADASSSLDVEKFEQMISTIRQIEASKI